MAMYKFITLLALAIASTTAKPTSRAQDRTTIEQVSKQCGNNQQISCCNNSESSILIPANCVSVPILAIPIAQQCQGNNVAACCDGDSEGLLLNLDLSCTPISL